MAAAADPKTSVLFVCTHNSARSQLAEALLRHRHGDRYDAFSAGTVARGVHPHAAATLIEAGIDPSDLESKTIESLGDRTFDIVVTVCDNAREACPYLPARLRNEHHAFLDPSAGPEGTQPQAFREVRDEIAAWLDLEFGLLTAPSGLEDVRALVRSVGLPAADLEDGTPVRVLERDGAVVGCVALEVYGSAGFLRSLAVDPSAQGEGLGGRLVEAAEGMARDLGLEAVYLLTTTAQAFFERRGYRRLDRGDAPEAVQQSSQFVSTCSPSAVCLGKRLSP